MKSTNTNNYKSAEDDNGSYSVQYAVITVSGDDRSAPSCRPQKYGGRTVDSYRSSVLVERYLTGEKECGYLHISPRTLQTLRDTRQIPYTVISGRVFLYPETEIRETLGKNYRPAESPF